MDTRDDDIEFDFFDDEPATGETQSLSGARVPRAPRREGGPTGPPHGLAPVLRLGGLVVGVVVLVLVFILLIQSCGSDENPYAGYMTQVTEIAKLSTANGKRVQAVLTDPALKVPAIEEKLRGIAASEQQNVQAAQALNAPGKLRDENAHLIEALQFRVSGTGGLAATFKNTAASKDNAGDAALLAAQGNRLVASDVVWEDLFRAPTLSRLAAEGVEGVRVPESLFIPSEMVTADSFELVLQRIRGASTGGTGTATGLHGTNIVSVEASPGGETLTTDSLNTVASTLDLAFKVTVKDSGDFQEGHIPVTLTIENGGNPIVKQEEIQIINPGEEVVVTFDNVGVVTFAVQTTLRIDVKPVNGEVKKDNNSAEYPVIFSLPQ